jgi:hypothetical protein
MEKVMPFRKKPDHENNCTRGLHLSAGRILF